MTKSNWKNSFHSNYIIVFQAPLQTSLRSSAFWAFSSLRTTPFSAQLFALFLTITTTFQSRICLIKTGWHRNSRCVAADIFNEIFIPTAARTQDTMPQDILHWWIWRKTRLNLHSFLKIQPLRIRYEKNSVVECGMGCFFGGWLFFFLAEKIVGGLFLLMYIYIYIYLVCCEWDDLVMLDH